ncbi:MAG TPA: cobalamin-binding protein [Thermodesulfovibrionales bacterium]|nr:cobalamin-binding protein [Thermodesulfovibrionales bacterium]
MEKIFLFLMLIVTCSFSSSAHAGETPQRIISLAPNMTEILFALGLGNRIVGVTSFCDYPAEAKRKPKVGGMSNPSLEAVISLKPDLVVMTIDGNPREFEERLRSLGIKTYVFRASRLRELPKGIRDLGKALGVQEEAETFAREFEAAVKRVGAGEGMTGSHTLSARKRVLFIVWPEPLIAAGPGTVIDDALALIGFDNIASDSRVAYPKYSIEEIIRRAPDVIIIGRGMERQDIEKISAGLLKRLHSVPAVRNKRVFYVSDDLYRLGPRTIRGIDEISRLVGQ